MIFSQTFICVSVLLSLACAQAMRIDHIVPPTIRVLSAGEGSYNGIPEFSIERQLQEDIVFAVNSSSSGFARTTNAGITVQRGTSGVLRYRIRVKAVESERLANSDSSFVSTLSTSERESYELEKRSYRGGLNVPFLRFIGINLGASVERTDMERSAASQRNYNQKATAAQKILETTTAQSIEISGTLRASGTSFIPTTVFAFIKIARVQTQDGSSTTVVTTDGNELLAADNNGRPVDSSDGTIEILPF